MLVLEGEPGIGKTTLWLEGIRRAKTAGWRVLAASPSEQEESLPYVALSDLIGATFDRLGAELPAPQQRALGAALLRVDLATSPDPRATATAFVRLLGLTAAEQPVLVAVDDVQWLDASSARVLGFAARRLPTNVSLLLATRERHDDGLPLGLDRVSVDATLEHVVVGSLSLGALHHVIAGKLATRFTRATIVRLASTSGGNPFYALELAKALPAGGATVSWADPLQVPRNLRTLVDRRLTVLSSEAREAVRAVSALSRPSAEIVLDLLAPDVDAQAALDEAVAEGVLAWDADRVRFTHPLLASSVYESMTYDERRRLHARLADRGGGDVVERARHRALATHEPDSRVAAELEEAASHAVRRGAPESAAELYEAASRLTPPELGNDLARRLLGRAKYAWIDEWFESRSLAERALELAQSAELRAESRSVLADLSWHEGQAGDAVEQLELALTEARPGTGLRATLTANLVRYSFSFDFERAFELAEEAVSSQRAAAGARPLASVLIDHHLSAALTGRGGRPESFARGLALEQDAMRSDTDGPQPMPIIWYHLVDELDAARARLKLELDWARERGDTEQFDRRSHAALAELRAGHWQVAEQLLEPSDALEHVELRGPVALVFEKRSLVDAHRGRIDRARATLLPLIDGFERAGQRWWAALCLSSLAFTEYAAGEWEAADRLLERMRGHAHAVGAKDILFDRSEPFHIEILVKSGELERARDVLRRLEERGRALPRAWIDATLPRARALVLAGEGDLPAALHQLQSVDESLAERLPFERACTLLLEGQLLRRTKHKGAAAEALGHAFGLFEHLGAPTFADRARDELARVGLRHTPDELTTTERRIAELAASGMTNREVAQTAFVSAKTVEANLSRVYRKLGIRSRAELGAWLARAEARTAGDATTPE